MNDDRLLVTETEAADLLGLQPRTLQRWRSDGGGPPYIRVSSRCVRYRIADLDAWAEERRYRSTSEEAAEEADVAAPEALRG